MNDAQRVSLEVADGVARVRLVRPDKRNAIDERFLDEFESVVTALEQDRRVRAVLLAGEGPTFCAGLDVSVLDAVEDPDERRRRFAPVMRGRIRKLSRILEAWTRLEPVTVGAIQGAAAGAGWSVALACDLRVAAPSARCWYPEVDLGTPLSPMSTGMLMRLLPTAVAKDIIFTCRRLDAAEMLALGLVNRIVGEERLREETDALVRALAAKPWRALVTSKATVDAMARGQPVLRTDLLRERD